jgi:hypothetical protein
VTPTPVPTLIPVLPRRVRPVLECVGDNGDGTYTAHFGYQNDNKFAVSLPVGTSAQGTNIFTPGGDLGQPTFLLPGRQIDAFQVTTAESRIVWSLEYLGTGRGTATASASSKRCARLEPQRVCVFPFLDNRFRALFGYQNSSPYGVSLSVGTLNSFQPAPRFRGQPTFFTPGSHPYEFAALFSQGETTMTWNLDGKSVSSDIRQLGERCVAPSDLRCTISPPVTVQCQGTQTKVSLSGTFGPDLLFALPPRYSWRITCDDPQAVIAGTDSLSPTVTLVSPAKPAKPGDGTGQSAFCRVSLDVRDDDPLTQNTTCRTSIRVMPCTIDCSLIPGGSAVPDQCGVCGGDNSSCAGCDGVPNSGVSFDECGVCGGDSSSCGVQATDCNGEVNGSAAIDRCGVCGGDGTSCLDCETVDNALVITDLDALADTQAEIVERDALWHARKQGSEAAQERARAAILRATELRNENWVIINSIPRTQQVCGNDVLCTHDYSNTELMRMYNENAEELRNLSFELIDATTRVPARVRRIRKKRAERVYAQVLKESAQVPGYASSCS